MCGTQALKIDNIPKLSELLETLPKLEANFDHVTELSLCGGRLRGEHMSFLDSFHQVRYLNLQDNLLTAVPQAVKDMPHLTHLFLDGNKIELDALAVDRLKNLTRMMFLRLERQPAEAHSEHQPNAVFAGAIVGRNRAGQLACRAVFAIAAAQFPS